MPYRVTGTKRATDDQVARGSDVVEYSATSPRAAEAAFLDEHAGTAVVAWTVDEVELV